MCGVVGIATHRKVCAMLLECLQRLEYRGYDSAGVAVFDAHNQLQILRQVGKVNELIEAQKNLTLDGVVGIAHTRWATHGKPTEANAHPQQSGTQVAVVHNGIIENHGLLRSRLKAAGFEFHSETDTEVIAHLIHHEVAKCADFQNGVNKALAQLQGSYAITVIHSQYPDSIIAARSGSPLVLGLGVNENLIASDPHALLPFTDKFIFLQENELAVLKATEVSLMSTSSVGINKQEINQEQGTARRSIAARTVTLDHWQTASDKGNYAHYMLKEIYEQPEAIKATLYGRTTSQHILPEAFGVGTQDTFIKTQAVHIVACGSSFYTGLVAKYWFEELIGIPCQVDIASEFRYRQVAVSKNTLLVTISQSGETADTLAALRGANHANYLANLCLCNVPNSSLVKESDFAFMMNIGPEICVASTKAFTAQLVNLLLLILALGKQQGLSQNHETRLVTALHMLPELIEQALQREAAIQQFAKYFIEKQHTLFLGRGSHYPIALEGALKLKEISYIHAEGYPAGELKHGPLALIDDQMPVVVVASSGELLNKVKSNLEEVRARGGQLFVFGDEAAFTEQKAIQVITMPHCDPIISPMIYAIPIQLLAYHVAALKGTDIDQPRNLAKSVTVE